MKLRLPLTKQAVAETVPHASRLVPRPTTFHARGKGEVDADQRHEQVAKADVEQKQVGGRPQSLEAPIERQDRQVVAEAEHTDGADSGGEQWVGVHGKQVVLGATRAPTIVGHTHRAHKKLAPSVAWLLALCGAGGAADGSRRSTRAALASTAPPIQTVACVLAESGSMCRGQAHAVVRKPVPPKLSKYNQRWPNSWRFHALSAVFKAGWRASETLSVGKLEQV